MKMYAATIKEDVLIPRARNTFYARQKLLFIVVVVFVSVIPLVGISFFSFKYYRDSWIESTSSELAGLADSRKEIIELFLADQNDLLKSLIALYPAAYLSEQANLENVFSATNRSGIITDLGFIDSDGAHRSYVGPFSGQLAGRNYANEQWFAQAMGRGEYTSDIFAGFRGIPHIVVAVTDPSRSYVLRATVNSDMFNSLLSGAQVGPGGDAYIVNASGDLQTPGRQEVPEMPFALDETQVDGDTRVYQTEGAIYAVTSLKNGEWSLVLKEDLDSSLSGFFAARNRAVALIVLAILTIASVATLLSSSLINRLRAADLKRLELNNRILQMEKMALVGRLASNVSHEINNPLQIIENQAGWIDELLEDEKAEDVRNLGEYRDAAKKIRLHVRRAKTITHRLLGFSRAGEQSQVLTDINSLIDETVSFLENEANENRILIKRDFQTDLPQIVTDPSQLQQVFLNIANNAMDAIERDGEIVIKTRVANGSGAIAVEFSDSGPGLNEELRRRIFDPFFTTKKGTNAGLGLSISYNIIQRLGGDVEARSGREGGTTFRVTLPADLNGSETHSKRGEKNERFQRAGR